LASSQSKNTDASATSSVSPSLPRGKLLAEKTLTSGGKICVIGVSMGPDAKVPWLPKGGLAPLQRLL